MILFSHQVPAFEALFARASLFFDGPWRNLPIRPRFNSLVVGATGVGKSTLVRLLAETLGIQYLRVSATSWMPTGAHDRGTHQTTGEIAEALSNSEKLVLFVDELEKLYTSDSSWQSYIRCELLDILDGRFPLGMHLDDYDIDVVHARLSTNTFFIAAGTFQSFFDSYRSSISGFSGEAAAPEYPEFALLPTFLPREITNRFNPDLIILRPLTRADYEQMIAKAASALPTGLRGTFQMIAECSITEAVKAGLGCRMIEQALLSALLKTRSPEPDCSEAMV